MSVFEAGMMICFGVSWPVAVYKTYKAKNSKGKSLTFSTLIIVGYICGLIHKIFFYYDWVLWLYLINMLFVLVDMVLCLKYRKNPLT